MLGVNGPRIEIDPDALGAALANAPAVRADLERIDLDTIHEIVGMFVGSARTLGDATRAVAPVVDDRPMQEYGVRSMLSSGHGVPASIVDLSRVSEWCPRCFMDGQPVPAVQDLAAYFRLLDLAYNASPAEVAMAARLAETEGRTVAGSRYLGAIVPESAELHNVLSSDDEDPDFAPEAFTVFYQRSLYQSIRALTGRTLRLLRSTQSRLPAAERELAAFELRHAFAAQLKAARERRGMSLHMISEITKVSETLFYDLERCDVSRWPTGIYRRAFFREYAALIGMPGEATVSEHEADRYRDQCLAALDTLGRASASWPAMPLLERDGFGAVPRVNLSVKLSALYSQLDPIDPEGAYRVVAARLRPRLAPLAILGLLGLADPMPAKPPRLSRASEGFEIWEIGPRATANLAGSAAQRVAGELRGKPTPADGEMAVRVVDLAAELAHVAPVLHDVSDGGLAVALAEMCLAGDKGLDATNAVLGPRLDAALFGEGL